MSGDLRGDFSRIRFNRRKNYTAVLEQQGRVVLDADANEQCFIDDYLRSSEIVDVVGEFGAPVGDAGFEITVKNNEILIGPGRYYVAGLLCDNPASVSYDNQPFLIDPAYSGSELIAQLASAGGADVLQVYLEVWQRLVTEIDDPCLREPALGQADTTARLQTVWRVIAELSATENPPAQGSPATENQLPQGSGQAGTTSCCQQMYAAPTQLSTGTMSATTSGPSADCGCQPVAAAGYQGIENQLYRVEIQTTGDETTATFKWSRDNGSVVATIKGISGSTLQLSTLGPDANLGLQAQDWVELSDDTYVFGDGPNRPGTLYQIQGIQPADLSVTLTSPVTGIDINQNARIRRWDESGPSAGSAGIPLSPGSWLQLENGIEIQFSSGSYNSGDYWTIPARTASGQIDWPPCGSDGNAFQPPLSTRVYRAPLACIHWIGKKDVFGGTTRVVGGHATWDDCRQLFNPLTSRPQAIHVTNISWNNDATITADELIAQGLTITLDRSPISPVTAANFIVLFEWAAAFPQDGQKAPSLTVREFAIFNAAISTSGTQLSWQLPAEATLSFLDNELLGSGEFARVRVKLLGQAIFAEGASGSSIFLDGRAFGEFASPESMEQISLRLPSGEGGVASDFESWFYLAPAVQVVSVSFPEQNLYVDLDEDENQFKGVSATDNGNILTEPLDATVELNYSATATVNLQLQASIANYQTGYVSIPPTVSLTELELQAFPVTVLANPVNSQGEGERVIFTITASLAAAVGPASQASTSFTLHGKTSRAIAQ